MCVLAFSFSITIGEVVLRWSGRVPMPPYPVICGRPDLYQRYDPYGYRLWPQLRKAETYVRSRPRRFEVVSNRQGFRSGRDFLELDA